MGDQPSGPLRVCLPDGARAGSSKTGDLNLADTPILGLVHLASTSLPDQISSSSFLGKERVMGR